MSKWISFNELLERLDIKKFEIFEYLKKGLQPYSEDSGKPLDCPRFCHMGPHHEDSIQTHLELLSGKGLLRGFSSQDLNEFKKINADWFEDLKNELKEIKKDDPDYWSWKWFDAEMWDKDEDLFKDYYGASSDDYLKQLYSDLEKAIFREDNVLEFERQSNVFPCKPDTKWNDIKITLIDNDVVRIETPQGKGRFSYHELGMSDGRTRDKKPSMLWALFTLFAEHQGFISSKSKEYDPRLPDTAKRLNKHLQKIFNINDSIYTGHYKQRKQRYSDQEKEFELDPKVELFEKGYKTKILFSDETISAIK